MASSLYPPDVLLAIWLMAGSVFGLACGLFAIRKNRSAVTWFILGLLSGPIAVAAILLQGRRQEPEFL